jgi:hypothetical protein
MVTVQVSICEDDASSSHVRVKGLGPSLPDFLTRFEILAQPAISCIGETIEIFAHQDDAAMFVCHQGVAVD